MPELFGASEWESLASALSLSPRQEQLLRCCFDGLSEGEMAVELGLSRHTVHTHLRRLYRKLRVTKRSELLLRALQELNGHPGGT